MTRRFALLFPYLCAALIILLIVVSHYRSSFTDRKIQHDICGHVVAFRSGGLPVVYVYLTFKGLWIGFVRNIANRSAKRPRTIKRSLWTS